MILLLPVSVSVLFLYIAADVSGLDDQEDDTEYNFWAEKHDDLEKEEFRTDRGVKIPRKRRERERETRTDLIFKHY